MALVLVDASKPVRELEKAALARLGLAVVTTAPGDLARTLRQVHPSLVLVAERGVDAPAVCREVRQQPGLAAVPILLLTDDDGPQAEARARAAGASGALPRPLTWRRLAEQLRPWLRSDEPAHGRRESVRVRLRIPLRYGLELADLTGYLYNLSRSGLYIMTERVFPRGTRLVLSLRLPNSQREYPACGRVVWVNHPGEPPVPAPGRPPGMGIEFTELPPATRNLIHLLVARLTRQGCRAG